MPSSAATSTRASPPPSPWPNSRSRSSAAARSAISKKGRVVICAAGTGNPFFTTDSAAALRAAELKCDIIFKATKVDGIYTADPEKNPNAERLPHVTYQRVLADRLEVMDASAIDLARGNKIPIYIFSLREKGNIKRALLGEDVGSIVSDEMPPAA